MGRRNRLVGTHGLRNTTALLLGSCLAVLPRTAYAHRSPITPGEFDAYAWDWTNPVVPLAVIAAGLYGRGLQRLWARAGVGQGISVTRAASLVGGLAALLAALISPLDSLGASLFVAHMAQHLALTLVVAPLLVMGRPDYVLLWTLPASPRRHVTTSICRFRRSQAALITRPPVVVTAYAAVLWLWHVPAIYDLVEVNFLIHVLEHATMLGLASLFWWRVQALMARKPTVQIGAIPFIFAFMLASLALGAGLTFAGQAWFTAHEASAPMWGLTATEDQQLGGLLMLMPATLAHLGVLLLILYRAYSGMSAAQAREVSAPAILERTDRIGSFGRD